MSILSVTVVLAPMSLWTRNICLVCVIVCTDGVEILGAGGMSLLMMSVLMGGSCPSKMSLEVSGGLHFQLSSRVQSFDSKYFHVV